MERDAERIQTIRRLKEEIYGEYGFFYYVPMAESYTVQIPVTVSCSYRRCLYCDLSANFPSRRSTGISSGCASSTRRTRGLRDVFCWQGAIRLSCRPKNC